MSPTTFRTRARTVDHLGREQIADCPTAISELWKNSYDAYAKRVALHLFSKNSHAGVAVLTDDGHGMSYEDFVGRWLTVGTESKATGETVAFEYRNGMPLRPKLGQKGIGRLSSANLGPLLLILSKKKDHEAIAALLDWRLFENPYLDLSDVRVPVRKLSNEGLEPHIQSMVNEVLLSVAPADKSGKSVRDAWKRFDADRASAGLPSLASAIKTDLSDFPFEPRHLAEWQSIERQNIPGTAMLVARLNFDLQAIIHPDLYVDTTSVKARKRFKSTLTNFVDPYASPENGIVGKFDYAVYRHDEEEVRTVLEKAQAIATDLVEMAEHQVDGCVGDDGVFRGRVRAFGVDFPDVEILPPTDLPKKSRSNTRVGSFDLFLATSEWEVNSSTLKPAQHRRFLDEADRHSGFLIFRDGLRVMPYGREDNDYFEIEKSRGKNAGAAFWNNRRLLARVAISRDENPNLKDKAGREGFIDNSASKTFRELVIHVLRESAGTYFGSRSKMRKTNLPDIKRRNKDRKAREQAAKTQQLQAQRFSKDLMKNAPAVESLVKGAEDLFESFDGSSQEGLETLQAGLERIDTDIAAITLTPPANKLRPSEQRLYDKYKGSLAKLVDVRDEIYVASKPSAKTLQQIDPFQLLKKQMQRGNERHDGVLREEGIITFGLLEDERKRLADIRSDRKDRLERDATAILNRYEGELIHYERATEELRDLFASTLEGSVDIYSGYRRALEALSANIDIDYLLRFGVEERSEMSSEIDKLTSLAQLGIAVEITSHEIHDYGRMIDEGIATLPDAVKETDAVDQISFGTSALVEHLKLLSPLQLSGHPVKTEINGRDIYTFLQRFFMLSFKEYAVELTASDEFLSSSFFGLKSRFYPAFVNLVNNSIYWTSQTNDPGNRTILLQRLGRELVVSDNGPGIAKVDIEKLFSLFFTRRESGRGVGLYLVAATLASGGHSIRYVPDPHEKLLGGAAFALKIMGLNDE